VPITGEISLPSNEAVKDEYFPRIRYFTAIDSFSLKTVTDRNNLIAA